jgi:prepilin-type processing-associated H-X9-DG protein
MLGDNDVEVYQQFLASGLNDSSKGLGSYVATRVQHENSRNYLFFDGHVESRPADWHRLQ